MIKLFFSWGKIVWFSNFACCLERTSYASQQTWKSLAIKQISDDVELLFSIFTLFFFLSHSHFILSRINSCLRKTERKKSNQTPLSKICTWYFQWHLRATSLPPATGQGTQNPAPQWGESSACQVWLGLFQHLLAVGCSLQWQGSRLAASLGRSASLLIPTAVWDLLSDLTASAISRSACR